MTPKGLKRALVGGAILVALAVVMLGPVLVKLDVSKLPTRASWQLPERVVEALALTSGDRVADLGAGKGYFTLLLADAVGTAGRVYAVDVDDEPVAALEASVASRGYDNVEVIRGEIDDPGLPDGKMDVVFLCDVYHHIDDRVRYFSNLRRDLAPGARFAIVEVGGRVPLRWLSPPGHSTPIETLIEEMSAAGYEVVAEFDFLPVHNFLVFGVP